MQVACSGQWVFGFSGGGGGPAAAGPCAAERGRDLVNVAAKIQDVIAVEQVERPLYSLDRPMLLLPSSGYPCSLSSKVNFHTFQPLRLLFSLRITTHSWFYFPFYSSAIPVTVVETNCFTMMQIAHYV